tara:strand:- start:1362 stop:1775 length:414 start_codon:yes stop_codon:yes gene_type:complete
MFSKKIDIRVYYEDTDSGGIVYYANYFKYTERCRTEFLRELGVSQTKIYKDSGIKFIVHSVSMEYLNPSYLDDILKVETKVINLKKASIEFEQKIYRKYDNQNIDIIKSKCKIVAIDKDSKITPIPNIILQSITERQ